MWKNEKEKCRNNIKRENRENVKIGKQRKKKVKKLTLKKYRTAPKEYRKNEKGIKNVNKQRTIKIKEG